MSPKITVHHLENSRSTRVTWLLEELGLPYELKIYQRHPKTLRAPAELKAIHPLGRSPVVEIEDGSEKYVLNESGAIMEFILDNYADGRLAPPASDKKRRAEHLFWLHYAEGGPLFPLWARMMSLRIIGDPKHPGVHKYITPMIEEHFQYIEDVLSEQKYFGGDEFSAADIAMAYTMLNGPVKKYKHSSEWLERVTAREAYKRTVEKSGTADPRAFTTRKESKL